MATAISKLRTGDYLVVQEPPFARPIIAEVVRTGFNGSIAVKLADGRQKYLGDSREIVVALRPQPEGWEYL